MFQIREKIDNRKVMRFTNTVHEEKFPFKMIRDPKDQFQCQLLKNIDVFHEIIRSE